MIGDSAYMSDAAILIQHKVYEVTKEFIEEVKDIVRRNPTEEFNIDDLVDWLEERMGLVIGYEGW